MRYSENSHDNECAIDWSTDRSGLLKCRKAVFWRHTKRKFKQNNVKRRIRWIASFIFAIYIWLFLVNNILYGTYCLKCMDSHMTVESINISRNLHFWKLELKCIKISYAMPTLKVEHYWSHLVFGEIIPLELTLTESCPR